MQTIEHKAPYWMGYDLQTAASLNFRTLLAKTIQDFLRITEKGTFVQSSDFIVSCFKGLA